MPVNEYQNDVIKRESTSMSDLGSIGGDKPAVMRASYKANTMGEKQPRSSVKTETVTIDLDEEDEEEKKKAEIEEEIKVEAE